MHVHSIGAQVHGRYLVDRPDGDGPWPVLVGFHGYAERGEHMLEVLKRIRGDRRWLLVSVQALNRFYTRTQEVVGNWMTREDREFAIADNIAYVAGVVAAVRRDYPATTNVVYVGFSQGVAMAYRALAFAAAQPANTDGPNTESPGSRANTEGPGLCANTEGPGLRANTEGPGLRANTAGPGSRANTEGPGLRANTEGPGLRANTEGPGLRANTEGPGLCANTEGPGLCANTEGPGFSPGIRPAGGILLAGDVPPDVVPRLGSLPPLLIGRGTTDDWYTESKAAADLALFAAAGVSPQLHVFEGGHVWDDGFITAAGQFLDRTLNPEP
jgi:predicted esterase